MTPTATALLGFAAWTLLMLVSLGAVRTMMVFSGKKQANAFDPTGADMEGFARRLTRVHANCYENLPIAGAVMLYAIATTQTALTDPLAYAFLGARVLQSIVHLVSTSNAAVMARFGFFIVQIVILAIWLLSLFAII